MPSVAAACGSRSAPRPRGQGAPGGGDRDQVGQVLGRPPVDAQRLLVGERAHRVQEDTARPHQEGGRRQEIALQRRELRRSSPVADASGRRAGGAARRCRCTARRAAPGRTSRRAPAGSGRRPRAGTGAGGRCGDGHRRSCGPARHRRRARPLHRSGRRARRWRWPSHPARRRRRPRAPPASAPGPRPRPDCPDPGGWRARRAPRAGARGRRCRAPAARRARARRARPRHRRRAARRRARRPSRGADRDAA